MQSTPFPNLIAQLARFGIEVDPGYEIDTDLAALELDVDDVRLKLSGAWEKIEGMLEDRPSLEVGLVSIPILVPYSDLEIAADAREGICEESKYKANARVEYGMILVVYDRDMIVGAIALHETGEGGTGIEIFHAYRTPSDPRYS